MIKVTVNGETRDVDAETVRLDAVADPALRPGIDLPAHLAEGRPAPGSTPLHTLRSDTGPG